MLLCQIHVLVYIYLSLHAVRFIQARFPDVEPTLQGDKIEAKLKPAIVGYLMAEASDSMLNRSHSIDAKLVDILNRIGPDTRPLHDFDDFNDITLDVAKRAWILMHHHAQTAVIDRVEAVRPFIMELLNASEVSQECIQASRRTFSAAQRLHSWAIQLLTAWGTFPPTGIYEGTFGDIGSFHGCLNVPENSIIGHAHYCSIAYRPVMPTRKNYELILRKEADQLLKLFDHDHYSKGDNTSRTTTDQSNTIFNQKISYQDAFTDLLDNAQYSHYIYYKFGTCFPIQCSPYDVQLLARLLGRRSILISGPVKCHSKYDTDYNQRSNGANSSALQISTRDLNNGIYVWRPHMTQIQWVSLLIISLLTLLIICLTIVDLAFNIIPELFHKINDSANNIQANGKNELNFVFCKSKLSRHKTNAELKPESNDINNNIALNELTSKKELTKMLHHNTSIPFTNESVFENADRAREEYETVNGNQRQLRKQTCLFMEIVDDCSIITNVRQFFRVSQHQIDNDILCINGIRCITMSWIVITHTMQYNDWSAFARTREIETHLKSLINQPLFNATYLVDTFFLMSGLLTSFSSFRGSIGDIVEKFSSRSYLIGRYLRLTPQIMFVSLLFILLPQLSRSGGPHWYTMTGEYSENCSQNWWINLFHIQAFYRSNEMCNFVSWWISVDMFYHLFASALILVILYYGHRVALLSCTILVLVYGAVQAIKHYQLALPPNLLSTIPQTGAMWSKMTLEFFWTPIAHAFPFFLGFYVGYVMAQRHSAMVNWFTIKRAILGWTLAACLLLVQLYSTHFWVIGRWQYTKLTSTIYYLVCPMIWASCLTWTIVACRCGYGGWINQMLSCRLFIILSKASFIVYLSHLLILSTFFGSQNLLLEPTQLVMLYIISGNICFSMLFGSLLYVVFEMPWLKTQRRIMKYFV